MESIIGSKDRLHFFEYMEAEVLNEYIRTGIHYSLNALLQAHPILLPMRYHSLEIASAIHLVLDLVSLIRKRASFVENFYRFERVAANGATIIKQALIAIAVPYLWAKAEVYFRSVEAKKLDGLQLSRFQKIFLALFPILHSFWGISQTVMKLRYLLVNSPDHHYDITYRLMGVRLQHQPPAPQASHPIMDLMQQPALLVIIMAHKALTWYYGQRTKRNTEAKPRQRKITAPSQQGRQVQHTGKCPLCLKPLSNPTVVRTTGHLYCHNCITDYVSRQGKCPLSSWPAAQTDLQLLYQ